MVIIITIIKQHECEPIHGFNLLVVDQPILVLPKDSVDHN